MKKQCFLLCVLFLILCIGGRLLVPAALAAVLENGPAAEKISEAAQATLSEEAPLPIFSDLLDQWNRWFQDPPGEVKPMPTLINRLMTWSHWIQDHKAGIREWFQLIEIFRLVRPFGWE